MRKVVAVGDSQQRKMLRALDLELFILIDHTFPLKGRRSRGRVQPHWSVCCRLGSLLWHVILNGQL